MSRIGPLAAAYVVLAYCCVGVVIGTALSGDRPDPVPAEIETRLERAADAADAWNRNSPGGYAGLDGRTLSRRSGLAVDRPGPSISPDGDAERVYLGGVSMLPNATVEDDPRRATLSLCVGGEGEIVCLQRDGARQRVGRGETLETALGLMVTDWDALADRG